MWGWQARRARDTASVRARRSDESSWWVGRTSTCSASRMHGSSLGTRTRAGSRSRPAVWRATSPRTSRASGSRPISSPRSGPMRAVSALPRSAAATASTRRVVVRRARAGLPLPRDPRRRGQPRGCGLGHARPGRSDPAVLADRAELLDSADLIVADTNLPAGVAPVAGSGVLGPAAPRSVSAAKASRAQGALPHVHTLKLNALEAGVILGREVDPTIEERCHARGRRPARARREARVRHARAASGSSRGMTDATVRLDAPSVRVANATGAGDAFTAGVACATLQGMTLLECAALGSAMARRLSRARGP